MKKVMLLAVMLLAVRAAEARDGSLEDRVRRLERAVERLEDRCGERGDDRIVVEPESEIWTCVVSGGKEKFYGNGETRGLAEKDAMEQCQKTSNICRLKQCSNE